MKRQIINKSNQTAKYLQNTLSNIVPHYGYLYQEIMQYLNAKSHPGSLGK